MADSIPPSQDKKRLKKCNFSREEIVLIQREVGKKYTIINSKHSNIITNEKKKKYGLRRPASWELPLVPQMKSKKNGTKENVGKWFYF
jgi:hypothetical protein